MSPTRKLVIRNPEGRILSHGSTEPLQVGRYPHARHTGNHDPVVMLARLACHLGKEGRSEILGMALAMEVL